VVLARAKSRSDRQSRWRCQCDCGHAITTNTASLLSGRTRSCGCWHREVVTTHGHTSGKHHRASQEYRAWTQLKTRCLNPKNNRYKDYGGRGITVCDAWRHDFMAFYNHIGPKPRRSHVIDRIDNNGHYEPGNVRWTTPRQSARNRRQPVRSEPGELVLLNR